MQCVMTSADSDFAERIRRITMGRGRGLSDEKKGMIAGNLPCFRERLLDMVSVFSWFVLLFHRGALHIPSDPLHHNIRRC